MPPPKWLPVVLAASFACAGGTAAATALRLDVRTFGAAGDGRADDTPALQKAIDAASAAGGGEVDLPTGTFLSGSLVLRSHVTLHLDRGAVLLGSPRPGDYPLITARWEGIMRPCHRALVSADHAEDITINGEGAIQGDGHVGTLRDPRGPTIVEPVECQAVRVEGITLRSTGIWTLHPTFCRDVAVSRVTFDTTGYNSDGIDPDSCQRVLIEHCSFSTDDDNIAIKSGKGQEGVRIGRPSEDITITDCVFIKGHSSIALGSELSGGIRRVRVANCVFQNGRAAIYVKSRPGRGGYVRDVTGEGLVVGPEPLLEIESAYPFNEDAQGVPGPEGLTAFGGFRFADVKASSKSLVNVRATAEQPVEGLIFNDITGNCGRGFVIHHARNVAVGGVHLDGMTGPLLQTEDVQGTGLEGAVPYRAPAPKPTPAPP